MGIRGIQRLIEDAADRAVSAGVPRQVAAKILMRAEADLINALLAENRRFLDECRAKGTLRIAQAEGVTQRAVQKRRTNMLKKRTNTA